MGNKFIRNYIAKQVAGRSDDGIMIKLSDPKKVDFQVAMMEDLLMRNGIDPRAITSENQFVGILNMLKSIEKGQAQSSGIKNTTSAKVFDLEGKEIKNTKNIMGGKEIDLPDDVDPRDTILPSSMIDDLPPPGSRGGKDDIAAPVQSSEESLKNMIEAENKKAVDSLKQKMAKEKARTQRISGNLRADNLNRYEIGKPKLDEDEYDYYREILDDDENFVVKGDETREFLEAMVKEQEDEVAYMKRLYDKGALDDPEKKATGGRVGLASGTIPGGYSKNAYKYIREIDMDIAKAFKKYKAGGGKLDFDTYSSEAKRAMFEKDTPAMKADGGRIGLKFGTGKKFLQKVFGKEKFKEMATRDPEMYQGLLEVVDMYRKRDKEGLKMYLQKFLPHMDDEAIEDFIIGSDGTEGLVGELIRLGSGRDYKGKIEMIKKSENIRKLDDLEVTDDMIRKPNADGGIMRLGFKDGMNRRTFLKLLGGAMSIPIVGKILKPFKVGKTITKVPIIKTDNVAGKPEWFDQLVNKVILEGDDVTKRFATKDREIVHMKKIDDDNTVMVYQDLDEGAVRIDYDAPSNMGEDTVSLQYKKPLPDEGDPRPTAEFEASELEPRYVGGPEDADIEFDGLGGGSSIKMLESDVSKLKEYATGQKPTMKEFIESKKRKDRVDAINKDQLEQAEYISGKYGDGPEPDFDDLEDFARGGIAKMLGE